MGVLFMKAYSTNHTCLSTRIKKRTSGFHSHCTNGAVDDLGARVAAAAVAGRLKNETKISLSYVLALQFYEANLSPFLNYLQNFEITKHAYLLFQVQQGGKKK